MDLILVHQFFLTPVSPYRELSNYERTKETFFMAGKQGKTSAKNLIFR